MGETDRTALPHVLMATPPGLPKALRARLWIDPWCFFSSGRADDSCWLWLLRDDGRVQAVRLANAVHGRDHLLGSLLAWLDAPRATALQSDKMLGAARLLPSAPVVPVTRWAISWGHPLQKAIRQFADLLNPSVLDALGRLEVPGPFFGSASNYNRLVCLPARIRRHRFQALDLFPPLVVPLLLDGYERPDMFSDNDYAEVVPARFSPTDHTGVLDAMDKGRDLVGALGRYWRVDRSLVRAPLSRVPWQHGRIDTALLQLINAIPAHRRPGSRDDVERVQYAYDELPIRPRTPRDWSRLAGLFTPNWDTAWQQWAEAFPALSNSLRDCRDFLRSALLQIDWLDPPAWLDMETLALGWFARRGVISLLTASGRWHDQALKELSAVPWLPDRLIPLLDQVEFATGRATELVTPASLMDEGEAMHHCVGEYWDDCLFGPTRIVHLELPDGSVATAQYDSSHDPSEPRFELVELRGRFNASPSQALRAFAEQVGDRLNTASLGDKRIEILAAANQLRSDVDRSQRRQTIRPLDQQSRRELRLVIGYCLKQPDWRAKANIVYQGMIAGFDHADGPSLKPDMRTDDTLELVREPDNPYDDRAVRVDWSGHKIGYIPRRRNHDIARWLDAGQSLVAVIDQIRFDDAYAPVDCVVQRADR